MTDRATALRLLALLRATPIGDEAVLIGSSGLFGFATETPALTEDIDIAVPEALVREFGDELVALLADQGFAHESGTATFVDGDGISFDLLGHGEPADGDHIGGRGLLRVMVFEDISQIVGKAAAVLDLPAGGKTLSPAGFVATKLLTERAHKGSKDKLQALLVMHERRSDEDFARELAALLGDFEATRHDDMLAASQDAVLALGLDPGFRDAGAEGYSDVLDKAQQGLKQLHRIKEALDGQER